MHLQAADTVPENAPGSAARAYSVSVRRLVEFVLRTGDLSSRGGVPFRLRAMQGAQAHRRLQKTRPEDYTPEVPIAFTVADCGVTLQITGRIDGVWSQPGGILLEEIKTVTGSWDGAADPLHWGQLKFYGFAFCEEHKLDCVDLQLSYFDLETEHLTPLRQHFTRTELAAFAQPVIAEYLAWIVDWERWRKLRDDSAERLKFPHRKFRKGQRDLSVAVYNSISKRQALFAEAPTGIGKTISVLFSAIKAMPRHDFQRVFYLTAKTNTQALAENALEDLRRAGLRFRSVTLSAKEKLCSANSGCQAVDCPFTKGYYDRLRPALREALQHENLSRAEIEQIAARHQVCPHEFSLDVSEWADAIVCDYNYVFDPSAQLKRHFGESAEKSVLLVDEAHNLVERARAMFSAQLHSADVRAASAAGKSISRHCAKALKNIELAMIHTAGEDETTATSEAPVELLQCLEKFLRLAEAEFSKAQKTAPDEHLLNTYFAAYRFMQTAELYDERYRTILTRRGNEAAVQLFCVEPSLLLRQTLKQFETAVFFSASLSPLPYFRSALGGTDAAALLRLNSPFDAANLKLLVLDQINTSFRYRAATLDKVCEAISTFVRAKLGNYLVFLPSHAYLESVRRELELLPGLKLIAQAPDMADAERVHFLDQFTEAPDTTTVGLAVMGGLFGEGIDLVGNRLIGAAIVGIGLPQLCLERNLIRAHFDAQQLQGFDYAYLFPGINRVTQAAGRVIRSEHDRGCILLIDSRFSEARVAACLPPWWTLKRISSSQLLETELQQFWAADVA